MTANHINESENELSMPLELIETSKLVGQSSYEGYLLKWTNYLYGWQKRYVKLSNGTLLYSIDDKGALNFQGLISLNKTQVKMHPKDDLRFDLNMSGVCYYFRASNVEQRMIWVNKILSEREILGNSFINPYPSISSISSLGSYGSQISINSKSAQTLTDTILEINQLKNSAYSQVNDLQIFFDSIIKNISSCESRESGLDTFTENRKNERNVSGDLGNFSLKYENFINFSTQDSSEENTKLQKSHRKSKSFGIGYDNSSLSSFSGSNQEDHKTLKLKIIDSFPLKQNIDKKDISYDNYDQKHISLTNTPVCKNDKNNDNYYAESRIESVNLILRNGISNISESNSISEANYFAKNCLNISPVANFDNSNTITKTRTVTTPGYVVRRPFGHRSTQSSSIIPVKNAPPFSSNCMNVFDYLKIQKVRLDNCAMNFKTTTNGLINGINSCLEQIENLDKSFKEELEKEREANKRLSKKIRELDCQLTQNNQAQGPDACREELDEVFYDALFTEMKIQENIMALEESSSDKIESIQNPYIEKVNNFERESLTFLTSLPNDKSWTLIYNDPPTILYKKEVLVDDIVMDPYRVFHVYRGISAKEVSRFFWDVSYRLKIDQHVDHVFLKANYGEDIVVVHHLHKTIWPAARRDSLIISKRRAIEDESMQKDLMEIFIKEFKNNKQYKCVGKSWSVTNVSVDYPDVAVHNCIRVDAKVGFLAQTFFLMNSNENKRENYLTLLNYSASINPGGWLPHTAVRTIARRELPKFLKTLGSVTTNNTSSLPIEI